jgi:hypothetical protein
LAAFRYVQELDDIALLRQYTERNSEEAFAKLVARHVNKVYSVSLHTGNPHQRRKLHIPSLSFWQKNPRVAELSSCGFRVARSLPYETQ